MVYSMWVFIFGFALGVLVVLLFLALSLVFDRKVKYLSHEKKAGGKYLVRISRGGNYYEVVGSCTVWKYYPSFKRCSTQIEEEMNAIWSRIEYEEENGKI